MHLTRPSIRVFAATIVLFAAIAIEGVWIVLALAVGGNSKGWLNYVILAWWLIALALLAFWRYPMASIAAALFNLVVCIRTFQSDGQDFHDIEGLLYRHCFDLVILGAAIVGFAFRRSSGEMGVLGE
jgi:hypothetical protein